MKQTVMDYFTDLPWRSEAKTININIENDAIQSNEKKSMSKPKPDRSLFQTPD